ncbi:hypothetical protein IDM40_03560 [Nocardiopsis sp. HNM0947]|uniref:Uncharacterized protein n=1 Tax=Nocardiopsis coralli TaxID=2772213 RepID=A0ABR9P1S6_9ACTN|nr:hypothetical protein [Nocardiopsis coralli]MBE2997789.1 hypothetical protein [Nocardiopsis coralli]
MAERPAGAAGGGRRTDTSGTGQEGPAERAGGPERPGVVQGQVVGSGTPESGHTPRAGAEPEEPATVRAHIADASPEPSGEGPGRRPVRRKPARKNRPLTPSKEQEQAQAQEPDRRAPAQREPSGREAAPQGSAAKASDRPWEGEPWRVVPHGMDLARVKERWTGAQGGFVDDPAQAVRDADALAAEVAEAVVAGIEERRARLRAVWDAGADTGSGAPDTESLRLVLREYRAYVERLTGD